MERNELRIIVYKTRRRILSYIMHLIYRLKCLLSEDETVTFNLIDGSYFDYTLKSAIGYALFCKDFEKAEIAFLRRSLKPGNIFLDIGANGGIYTIIASKLIGAHGRVYAFEPGEKEIGILKHNIIKNKLENVTVIENAVSNVTGFARFAIGSSRAMNSLAYSGRHDQKIIRWQTVITISLDDFMARYSVPRVDFIKIDVEGAEKLVLDGAKNLMSSKNKITILFEASDFNEVGFGYSSNHLLSELSLAGFDVYYLDVLGNLHSIKDGNKRLGISIYNFVALTQ